jgi:hypothetical protein
MNGLEYPEDAMRQANESGRRLADENNRLAAFAREIISFVFDGTDADGASIQMLALHHGLLERTLYDPEIHGPSFAELGAEWFEYTDMMKRYPGQAER